jgi:predicted MFS family arabinose efflux permease
LLSANSTTTLIYQLGITIGALLGGVLVAIGGPLAGLWVNAASFLVSAIGMTAIRWIAAPPTAQVSRDIGPSAGDPDSAQVATYPGGTWRGFVATLQMIRSRPRIWHLTALYLGLQAAQRLMSALLVPFLKSVGLGAGIQGALQMSFGLGSVLAGAVIPAIVRRFGGALIIGIGSLGVAAFMTLFSLTNGAGIALLLYGALGLAISSWVFSLTQAQLDIPSRQQGTYLATSGSLVSLSSLAVFASASLLLSRIGPRPVYWIGAVALLIVALPSVRYLRRNGFVDRCAAAEA